MSSKKQTNQSGNSSKYFVDHTFQPLKDTSSHDTENLKKFKTMNENKKVMKDKGKKISRPANIAELKKLGVQIEIKKEQTDLMANKAEQ